MKFSQLPVGESFTYEGRRYTKVGPLTAAESGGGQRMLPRWAIVERENGAAPQAAPQSAEKSLSLEQVLESVAAYHGELLAFTQSQAPQLKPQLEAAYQQLVSELEGKAR